MPRQTAEKSIIFPDGFKFSIDTGDGFEDVGLLSGGSTATFSYDEFDLDAGNYEDLLSYAKNPTVALAPSAIWNWNNSVITKLMTGFAKVSNTSGGTNLEFNGNARHFTLTRANLKLTHFNGEVSKALVADDITALDTSGTNNDIVTVPKATFVGALPWTTKIDSVVEIEGMREVHVDDKDLVSSQGNFYTDETNLYFIVAAGDLSDLDDAKDEFTGTVVKAYTSVDWEFTLYNAKVDAGASMNFKGVNEDGLSEYTVSFTGRPDPAQSYRLFKFFRA
jgi:hypothetical protein